MINKNFALKTFSIIFLIAISGYTGYFYGTNKVDLQWKNFRPVAFIQHKSPPQAQQLNMDLFYDVLDRVNNKYYDKSKIDPQKLTYGAISGMLGSLDDPYTSFFPPKENTNFKTQLSGEFHGIGAELGMSEDNRITVVAPLDDSPAQKAGIKSGDLILKVDGKDTFGWTLAQAVEKIRGPKGSTVSLSIQHFSQKDVLGVSIIRDVIVVKSVGGWVKDVRCDGKTCKEETCDTCASFAYLRLSQFGDKTNDEWVSVINKVSGEITGKKNFKGVILDLRNNPGGYLKDAVFIASEFLKSGVVVSQESMNGDKYEMNVVRRGLLTDYPVVILVNKGSASASEIVAGALRDNRKIKLIGENTFGKGTIQEAVDVDGGGSVHLSVAKWLTPKGTWVNNKGLAPDVKVEFDSEALKNNPQGFDNQLERAMQELLK